MNVMKDALLSLQNDFKKLTEKLQKMPPSHNVQTDTASVQSSSGFQRNGYRKRNRNGKQRRRYCYECGSENHIRPTCPTLQNHQNQNTGSDQFRTRNNSAYNKNNGKVNSSHCEGSGLYITGMMSGKEVDCLIDAVASFYSDAD